MTCGIAFPACGGAISVRMKGLMTTMILPLITLLSLLLSPRALARVGETEAQCVARYGKPVGQAPVEAGRGDKEISFRKSAFDIRAVFDNGRAVSVTYERIPKAGKSSVISPDEQMQLMKNNGGKKAWKKLEPTKSDDKYETADGKLRGRYNRSRKYLQVYDTAWSKSLNKRKEAVQKTEKSPDLQGL